MALDPATSNVSREPVAAKLALASVAKARQSILSAIEPLGTEIVATNHARGRVLAAAVVATRDQPPYDSSSMDGYAVRSGDCPGQVALVGEAAAGRGYDQRLGRGEAVRVSTGAPMPDGADAVVIQEDVTLDGWQVSAPEVVRGANVRPRAMDFATGTVLLEPGRRLDGVALALVAAAGEAVVTVRKKPRIAILSSGDELVPAGAAPGRHQVFDSAVPGVAALIEDWGGLVTRLPIERDDITGITNAAAIGMRDSDLLVVIGGASVGDHDHAKPALGQLGLELLVDRIAMRPGKPLWFGTTPMAPVLGLPGNPASALVCAHLFLRPILEAMAGHDGEPRFRRARLTAPLPANGPREHYLRGWIDSDENGQLVVTAYEQQDSSLLSVFSAANALIRLPVGADALSAGVLVDVLPLGSL